MEIYEVGQHQDQPYLVLEYLDGGTLEDAVRGAPVSFDRAALLVETVAEAHQAGLVHRDLKPSNILLTSDGTPKIADFGLVKHLASHDGLTTAGYRFGKTIWPIAIPKYREGNFFQPRTALAS